MPDAARRRGLDRFRWWLLPHIGYYTEGNPTGESRSRPVEGTANPQRPDIPVETYVSHALTGAAFTARIFWEQPVLTPEDAKKFGQWAEAEFLRIAHKEVGERDLIG